jgi:hypothetical protein
VEISSLLLYRVFFCGFGVHCAFSAIEMIFRHGFLSVQSQVMHGTDFALPIGFFVLSMAAGFGILAFSPLRNYLLAVPLVPSCLGLASYELQYLPPSEREGMFTISLLSNPNFAMGMILIFFLLMFRPRD